MCRLGNRHACRAQGGDPQICPSGGVRSTLETEPCSLVLWKQTHFSLCFPNKISGYTLTVQASDNGSPPEWQATVNIGVSDVNDNAPVFSRGNYSLIIQVTVGPGLLECVPVKMCALMDLD